MDNPNDVRRYFVEADHLLNEPSSMQRGSFVIDASDHDCVVRALQEEKRLEREEVVRLKGHLENVISVRNYLTGQCNGLLENVTESKQAHALALADGAAVREAYKGCDKCLDACVEGPYCLACLDKQAALSKQSHPGQAMVEELARLTGDVGAKEWALANTESLLRDERKSVEQLRHENAALRKQVEWLEQGKTLLQQWSEREKYQSHELGFATAKWLAATPAPGEKE